MTEIETGLRSLASQTVEFEKTVTSFCDSTCKFSEVVMKSLGKTDSYSQEVLKYRQAVNGVTSKGSPHSAISTIKLSLVEIRTDINKSSLKKISSLKKRVQASETKHVQIEGMQSEIDYMKETNKPTYEEKIKKMESDVKTKRESHKEERNKLLEELEELKKSRAGIFRQIFRKLKLCQSTFFECATGAFKGESPMLLSLAGLGKTVRRRGSSNDNSSKSTPVEEVVIGTSDDGDNNGNVIVKKEDREDDDA
jgi:chromosome segregation ATPase